MGTDIKVNDKIVFYDGFCVMCSRFIRFIVFLDKRKTFKFSAISSDFASKVLSKKLDEKQVGKFIVYLSENKVYKKSDAVIQIMIDIGGIFNVFKLLKIFPSKVRDIFYDIFANNRYKWFGRSDVCHVAPKEISDQFINK